MQRALSTRAQLMLERVPRDMTGQPRTREEVEAVLRPTGCPLDHPIVGFQLTYAGYGFHEMRLGMGQDPYVFVEDSNWFCEFGTYTAAPFYMMMDTQGAVYAVDNAVQTPLATRIEVFIESEAMQDTMRGQVRSGFGASLTAPAAHVDRLQGSLDQIGLTRIPEATDKFGGWWIANECVVHLFRGFDDGASTCRIGVFGRKWCHRDVQELVAKIVA